jgi:type IV pilus assembly protein PilE
MSMFMPSKHADKLSGNPRARGFTLVELMITVVIIGIIAAIAYPGYRDYVRKARRTDAFQALAATASKQELFYTKNLRYATSLSALGLTAPFSTTTADDYRLSLVTAATAQQFTLSAVPTVSGRQATDSCGTLTINYRGSKTPANCW